MRLEHGGNVYAAAAQFDIPIERWVDLSTGISPHGWPVPPVPPSVWQALPGCDAELERAAAHYYGCDAGAVLAVPGSQYALQNLPSLMPRGRVAIPRRGYAEHRAAWTRAGHDIVEYVDGAALDRLVAEGEVDHAVLINPNNPTGELLPRERVAGLAAVVRRSGGYLLVDEAFVDGVPEASVAPLCPRPGLVVLRSVGKFFGLAGLRLGFMLATGDVCRELGSAMPPWAVSHPARWIGERALSDGRWHKVQSARLEDESRRWLNALHQALPDLVFAGTELFVSGSGDAHYCRELYAALGRRAVLVRVFDDIGGRGMLRFGLPTVAQRSVVLESIRESAEECACGIA